MKTLMEISTLLNVWDLHVIFFLKIYVFICKRYRWGREVYHSLICFPCDHNSQLGAKQKPRTRNVFWIVHNGGRGPSIWNIFHDFSQTIHRETNPIWAARTQTHICSNTSIPGSSFIACAKTLFLSGSYCSSYWKIMEVL